MSNNVKFNQCPYCKSENISGFDGGGFDGSVCNNKVECNDCEKQWEECYEITSRFDVDGKLIDTFETYCNKENV